MLKNDSASKSHESAKNFKKIAEILKSEDFFVVDDEILYEFFLTFLLKMLVIIHTKKIFFYIILIKMKLEVTLSQNIKEFTIIESQLNLLKLIHFVF